jgi:hypothetical protein
MLIIQAFGLHIEVYNFTELITAIMIQSDVILVSYRFC